MKKLTEQTLARVRAGEAVIWCVILRASGSTPRDAGARMAVFADGSALGTVGGGEVELRAILDSRERLTEGRAWVRDFDLDQGAKDGEGMVCGGRVTLGFLPLGAAELPLLEDLDAALAQGRSLWLETAIRPDGSHRLALREDGGLHDDGPRLPPSPTLTVSAEGWILTEPLAKDYRVYLIGGGHVGFALAPLLVRLGFPVTVCDHRPELAQAERWPGARVLLADLDRLETAISVTERDYVVVMTPAHAQDLTVLRQILRTPARYIGCIGSRRKTAYVNQILLEEGFSPAQLRRIHAPIGLPIGARTPEEIAVSIAGELILHRSGKAGDLKKESTTA